MAGRTGAELDRLLENQMVEAGGCLAVSPHLDDAVLSAGGWLATLATRVPVLVVTVFSAAAPPPHGWTARRFTRACGHADPEILFAARRTEDDDALAQLGLTGLRLGHADAVFRRTRLGPWSRPSYPTLRFDALRGRVAGSDTPMRAALVVELARLFRRERPALVLAPLGIGRHVDHLITRDAVRSAASQVQQDGGAGPRVVYASDQPYAATAGPDARFVRAEGLVRHEWVGRRAAAVAAAQAYRSQLPMLYPGGRMPVTAEQLWLAGPVI